MESIGRLEDHVRELELLVAKQRDAAIANGRLAYRLWKDNCRLRAELKLSHIDSIPDEMLAPQAVACVLVDHDPPADFIPL